MRMDICTIPLSEIFEPRDGCPVCRMRDMLDERYTEYITGAAMMEPDERIRTNELGFCNRHYSMMLKGKHRLQVALMLSSHLDSLDNDIFGGSRKLFKPSPKKSLYRSARVTETCFICERAEKSMEAFFKTMFSLYETDRDFRKLFSEQTGVCLPHYALLCEKSEYLLSKKMMPDFRKELDRLTRTALSELREDVLHFTKMYDYRNSGENADWGNSRDSIERSVRFLTGFDKGEE